LFLILASLFYLQGIVAFTYDDQIASRMEKQQATVTSDSKGVINEVLEVCNLNSDLLEEAEQQQQTAEAAPAPQAAPADDMTTQLQQLAELKNQGILTEEEFTAKKKQILGI
jgi:hypothetical protein